MLIEYSVTNFRSIKDTQRLSMMSSPSTELQSSNCFKAIENSSINLLKSAVIYGSNASGKSNFINSLSFMENFVLSSSKDRQEGEFINVKPYAFNSLNKHKPSEFEVIFVYEKVRYQYGFNVTQKRVTHEWLLAYPEGRPQRWFEREFDTKKQEYVWYFGSKFKGQKNLIQESTRANALFLSTAVQLNNEQLKPVYNWFYSKLHVLSSGMLVSNYTTRSCKDEKCKEKILRFLNAADPSIIDIKIEKKKLKKDEIPSLLSGILNDEFYTGLNEKEFPSVKFFHQSDTPDESVKIDLYDESDGTQRLYNLAGLWLDLLDKDCVLVVDELDRSLHPLIVRSLVESINKLCGENKTQLIFTTHDTSILDNKIFRRDQVWFVEKSNNSSDLYPLSDFTPRKGEALGKCYLQGRYGALPYIGEFKF